MKPVSAPNCLISSCTFSSKPVMSAETSMITLTPRTTPNTVSALRILCARSVSMACFRFSPCACAMCAALSFSPQRFDWIELRGPHGGVDPEEKPHTGRDSQGEDHRANGGIHGEGKQRLHGINDQVGGQDSNQSADRREHRGLGHELQ